MKKYSYSNIIIHRYNCQYRLIRLRYLLCPCLSRSSGAR